MSVTAELAQDMRLADPKPSYCCVCLRGADADVRFVDMNAAVDAGQVTGERDGVVVFRESMDDMMPCEDCIRSAARVLGFKPELHLKQLQEIEQLRLQVEHWRATAKRAQEAVAAFEVVIPKRGGRR